MSSTLTRRTARLAAVLGAVPVALALFAGGNASAGSPAVFGPPAGSAVMDSTTTSSTLSTSTGATGYYVANRNNTPPATGNGGGHAPLKVAGTVGNADDRNPAGQLKKADLEGGSNNGYECDGNNGIALGNPAHTSTCASATVQ